MFFRKKICSECGSEYDEASPTCPACGTMDVHYGETKLPEEVTWMPWWKQLIVFLIGSIGLTIAATVVSLIFVLAKGSSDVGLADTVAVDFIGYAIIIIGMIVILWPHYKELFKSFKKWLPYLMGLAGAGVLYLFALFYGVILQYVPIDVTNNANQALAEEFVIGYPGIAIVLIGILGPLAEELTYRVGLYTLGLRVKKWVAYVAVTIIFAFIHFDFGSFSDAKALTNELLNLPSYAFAGLTLCFLYDKWGLSASLTAHILNNVVSCIFILL